MYHLVFMCMYIVYGSGNNYLVKLHMSMPVEPVICTGQPEFHLLDYEPLCHRRLSSSYMYVYVCRDNYLVNV